MQANIQQVNECRVLSPWLGEGALFGFPKQKEQLLLLTPVLFNACREVWRLTHKMSQSLGHTEFLSSHNPAFSALTKLMWLCPEFPAKHPNRASPPELWQKAVYRLTLDAWPDYVHIAGLLCRVNNTLCHDACVLSPNFHVYYLKYLYATFQQVPEWFTPTDPQIK